MDDAPTSLYHVLAKAVSHLRGSSKEEPPNIVAFYTGIRQTKGGMRRYGRDQGDGRGGGGGLFSLRV